MKKISTRPLFWLFCGHLANIKKCYMHFFTHSLCVSVAKVFNEERWSNLDCIFKIRSRVKMEMCFCDYLLCIISSICRFTYLKFFIISSSFFFPGILNSWLRLHGSEEGHSTFQVTGMIRGFWVWNFRFWDFFLVGKFGQVFFGLVWFIKFGYSKQSENLW